MAKVNVSMPDELMREVDELASELHRSRSGIVQEATANYVARLLEERAARERRQAVERAMADARELAAEIGSFDATKAIRADRDRDDAPRDVSQ